MISNNSVRYTNWGFQVYESNNNTIKGNIINYHEYEGIDLFNSSRNIIQKNQISFNNETGINLFGGLWGKL